jgi:hypothetical protein
LEPKLEKSSQAGKERVCSRHALMLACMNSELHKQYETTDPYDMLVGLRGMFKNQVRAGKFNTLKALCGRKLVEVAPISPHVIKMIGYFESL